MGHWDNLRQSFHSYSWLSDSSVIHVYDVSSTKTRIIMRNDNYGKTSRLRQHAETDIKRLPDPGTQSRASFTKNPKVQKQSHNAIALYNEHETHTDIESFRSNNQRPRTRFPVLTAVNQKRHTSCAVSIDQAEFSPGMTTFIQWQRSLVSQRINMVFNSSEAPSRTKQNLYKAERTYSSRNLMELKRKQYILRLNQNKRAFQGNHGNYMRYINQSKTVPLPSKSGWKRPKWLPKLVTSGESAKDNSQKQRTTDKKVCSPSDALQKSHTVKFGKSKPDIKKQVEIEMQKQKSSKKLVSTDQAVNVTRRPQGSKPSFLLSPNGPSKGPTNSGSQESTEKVEDVESKGELKDAVEIGEKVERDNSDKHLSSGDKNQQRQTITIEEVDIPMSLPGHVSPKGVVNEMLDEQDFKAKYFEQTESIDEMNKKCQEHESRMSAVERHESRMSAVERHESRMSAVERQESRKNTFIKDHEKMKDEDQKSNDIKHRKFADEINEKSQEHDSFPSAVERQESEKNTSSKVHENLQEKEQLTDFGESEYVDEMNKKSHDHSRSMATESPESGKGTSNKVSVKLQEEEEEKSTELKERESVDEMDRKSQEDENRDSPAESPDAAKKTSNEVSVKLQEEEEKSTELEERESVDEMDRKSQEDENRDSRADSPDAAKKTSNEVSVKLQEEEEEKSTELKERESVDEMDRKSQEDENRDSRADSPDAAKKTSNEVDENLEDENRKSRPSTVKRPESGDNTLKEGKDPQTQASINGVEQNNTLINQQTEKLEK